jgi:hypothetical protein
MSMSLSFSTLNDHRHHRKQPMHSSHIHYYKLVGVIHLLQNEVNITNLQYKWISHKRWYLEWWLLQVSGFPSPFLLQFKTTNWLVKHFAKKRANNRKNCLAGCRPVRPKKKKRLGAVLCDQRKKRGWAQACATKEKNSGRANLAEQADQA